MFNRNYDNVIALQRIPYLSLDHTKVLSVGHDFSTSNLTLKTTDNTLLDNIQYSANQDYCSSHCLPFVNISTNVNIIPSQYGITTLMLGSNNSEVTYDDTTIHNPIIVRAKQDPSLTNYLINEAQSETEIEYDNLKRCWKKTFTYDFQSIGSNSIGEIGFYYGIGQLFNIENATILIKRDIYSVPKDVTNLQKFAISFDIYFPTNPNESISLSSININ